MGRVCDVATKAFRRGDRVDVMSGMEASRHVRDRARARRARGRPARRRDAPSTDPMGVTRMSGLFKGRTWWKRPELKKSYDVVIIGGGAHGIGDRLLPREEPRHHERRGAREELHRRRRHGPQHDDHPLELPHARGHPLLRALDGAVPRPLAGARHQPDAVDPRPLHARPHRLVGARAARARRDEPAARRQLAADRPRGDRGALPRAEHVDGRRLPDPGGALPPARRRRCATTPSSGATPPAPTTAACTCTRASR